VGIEQVSGRIANIQSRIIALQTQVAVPAARTTATSSASKTSFASALSTAMASQSATSADATSASAKTYQLNSKGVPVDLAAYGNGKIPANALQQVGDTRHTLWAPAAEQLTDMIADAKRDGVTIGITDSYRPYAEQVDLVRRKGLYSEGGLAARPGTSEHGWGMAADLDLNGSALSWMRDNAGKYGFEENVPRETWHWAYKPKT
jgi:LAS superfamily LD-carboxypeptidase LdcB